MRAYCKLERKELMKQAPGMFDNNRNSVKLVNNNPFWTKASIIPVSNNIRNNTDYSRSLQG